MAATLRKTYRFRLDRVEGHASTARLGSSSTLKERNRALIVDWEHSPLLKEHQDVFNARPDREIPAVSTCLAVDFVKCCFF